ncbi:pullulanase-type alpha-1,6-glucosidase [Arthrobacter sp. CG_A4]|uniref:pullulanase-type alpha-1,6-glucosidase n=1 Tax=Arthrobacter sp. CG_A4 TaxID=3071706 RepID=UPI002E0AF189|nr:pullulanase-type alpha-1,6-glucosidase [Arthrobacter sp. CG_A4]
MTHRSTLLGPPAALNRKLVAALVAACATPLALGGLALPAFADHTAAPQAVVLVGSLQSEIGCTKDWQPDCAASKLQPVEGSASLYRATFDIPAGTYGMKVAINNSWDENYGAGGAAGGGDVVLSAPGGPVTFTYDHASHTLSDDVPDAPAAEAGSHWLSADTIAWQAPAAEGTTYRLYSAPDGGMAVADGRVTGGSYTALEKTGDALDAGLAAKYPHLGDFAAFRLAEGDSLRARELLKGQLIVAAVGADGKVTAATGVQVPGVLDTLYRGAAEQELGLRWKGNRPELSLWAPTARSVTVHTYASGSAGDPVSSRTMEPGKDGVWSMTGDKDWKGAYYLYEVEVFVPETGKVERNLVTDPYSVGLSAKSERSLFVDVEDKSLAPAGWKKLQKPALSKPEDLSLYELQVRDFSITDESVPEAHRGTYKAFTDSDSNGMRRLRELTEAGMNAVHLLPVNDIGTIEERRSDRLEPACDLAALPADSGEQQSCVGKTAAKDGFNWGYDPLHYTAPEGSYATNPDGTARITEFREMVAALNTAGARVIQDVVYNHTSSAGQSGSNNLDRIVPGYYHRLNAATGSLETSTCCANTATENAMMGKLMIDSLVTLAKTYKLDGFRFDLMGHHSKQNLLDVRAALDELTPAKDGVDGKNITLYGEGWNFGEVADNARFVQATQANMAGTGIGTFNDRLRDAVRGGGPFDPDPRVQGFGSGLFTDPNSSPANGTPEQQKTALLLAQDLVKVGLTGNLKDYSFVDRTGAPVTGADVPYNGAPAGYTSDPQEAVSYVEAHDNETLFDSLALKLPQDTVMADRTRMQTLSLSTTAFSQGISFWHAGGESLRSKSLDRNSYDSGDWFNILDHTDVTNGFGRGLPPKADNEDKYNYMRPLLADPAQKPASAEIAEARGRAAELLQIRKSTPLFHLGEASLVQQKVSFPAGGPEQAPGVVVMRIDDTVGPDVDKDLRGLVVVFNAADEPVSQTVAGTTGAAYTLHPVQSGGIDPVVKKATHDSATGTFTVPARTVAVFQVR